MCLGVPGQVLEIYERDGLRFGRLEFGGLIKEVCLEYVPEIRVGEYAIVHVGFAITMIDTRSAQETLDYCTRLGMLEELDEVPG